MRTPPPPRPRNIAPDGWPQPPRRVPTIVETITHIVGGALVFFCAIVGAFIAINLIVIINAGMQ